MTRLSVDHNYNKDEGRNEFVLRDLDRGLQLSRYIILEGISTYLIPELITHTIDGMLKKMHHLEERDNE